MEKVFEIIDKLLENVDNSTANRMSIINGKIDFTEYSSLISQNVSFLTEHYGIKDDEKNEYIASCIAKIIAAEIAYQKDDCYNALILINSALAFLEQQGYEEIWMVARYVQMCIMIVTGQIQTIFPIVGGMKDRIYASKNKELIRNYNALCAWVALYDDDWDTVDKWMQNDAPNEFEKIELKDTFSLFVKARICYMQSKNLSVITIMQSMQQLLESNYRWMELCEMNMIIAMAMEADNHIEEAYVYFEKCLKIAEERGFLRLLADEGEPIYKLIRSYTRNYCKESDTKFIQNLKKKSREMALMYPKYLKNHTMNFPKLTQRELETLKLLVDERNNIEIAEFFGCSVNTVKYHLKNIFRKMNVTSRKEVVNLAIQERLIK